MSIKNCEYRNPTAAYLNSLSVDEKYMLRCIQIAKNGLGTTSPNPMVGAIIVHKGKIIGEGYTSPFGGAHAEVNAIASVKDTSLLKSATLYVTLEPCSHYGKTPPCADLIIKHHIPKVVIGLMDPHEKVAGEGIKKLEKGGCLVEVGILKNACTEHHKRFLTFQIKKRPYIILKWAETKDGFIAPEPNLRGKNKEPYWITNNRSRQLVHKWRSEEQAILVGTKTALADNPKLNIRDWTGRLPTRIVVDRNLTVPSHHYVFDGKQATIVCTAINDQGNYIKGITYVLVDFNANLPEQLGKLLYHNDVQSIIIEGGTKTLQSFINANLWDEARIFKGRPTFGKGLKAPKLKGTIIEHLQISTDTLTILQP